MDYLWTPWRYRYVSNAAKDDRCVFCDALGRTDDEETLVIERGAKNFVILNKYPYTSGHLMVVPYAHIPDLASADAGICPMEWQKQQFPREFHAKLEVMHEGIDVDGYQPAPGAALKLPRVGLDFPAGTPLITYVSRGLEPYRGFPQFIEAVHTVQQRHREAQVVIAGEDRVAYGRQLPEGQSYKKMMLERFPLDPARTLIPGSPGEYAWGGAATTSFWIDPAEELVAIFMTQVLPSTATPIRRELRTMIYSAITDSNI